MNRPVLLIEIGAGPLPAITPVSRPRGSWVPVVYQAPLIDPPAEVTPTPVTDGVLLQWAPVPGVGVVYIIDRSAAADGPWLEIARTTATRYLYSDGTNSVWYFRIRASINGRIGSGSVVRAQLDMTTEKIRQEFLARVKADQDLAKDLRQQAQELANLQALVEAPEWIDQDWPAGSIVKHEGGLYVAKQDVPQGAAIDDASYWSYIGQYASLAEAVGAIGVSTNEITTLVEQLDDELRVLANDVSGVQSSLSGKADASAVQSMATRLTQAENSLTSLSQQISTVQSQIAGKADSNALQALQTQVTQLGNAVTATSTAITSVVSRQGGGVNILPNAGFEADMVGWSLASDEWGKGTAIATRNNFGDDWRTPFRTNFGWYTPGVVRGGYVWQSQAFAADANTVYILSIYAAAHRLNNTFARIVFVDVNGREIGNGQATNSIGYNAGSGGGKMLSDWTRLVSDRVTSPAGTVGIRLQLWTFDGSDPVVWWQMPMVEAAGPQQTIPSVWQPGAVGIDTKYAQATQSLSTRLTRTENGVNSYEASSTLALDVNGRVVGTRSVNNGTTGTIDFVFDKVRFLSPDAGGARAEMINGNYFVWAPNGVRVIAQGWSI